MNRFKTKKPKKKKIELYLIIIILLTIYFLHTYNNLISDKVVDIAENKIEEVTNMYVKKNIIPDNINISELIHIYQNDAGEIISLDVDSNYSNKLLVNIITKIQNNINNMPMTDDILRKHKNTMYLRVPLFISYNGVLLANLGPKIPIKLSFYEHSFGNIEVKLTNYGINNVMVSVYLNVSLEQRLYIPYNQKKKYKQFDLLLGTKLITGKIPNIYGGSMVSSSKITSN